MELLKRVLLLVVISYSINIYAHTNTYGVSQQTIPFQDVSLHANAMLSANYSFGTNAIIFCYSNSAENIGRISWTYKGRHQSGMLPIFLTTNPIFQGEFADSNGAVTIKNTVNDTVAFNCVFGF